MEDIGVKARRKKRLNHIDRVHRKSRQIFEKYFPNPEMPPEQEVFYQKWTQFINELADTFGQLKDYRHAFYIGVNNVRKYKKLHNWNVIPPSYIITKKSPNPLRTLSWMQKAWKAYDFYQHWYYKELLKHSAKSKEQAFRNIVLSFIYHSGQSNPDVVDAFQASLTDPSISLSHWEQSPYLSVQVKSNHFNTNTKIGNQQITQFHCYLHAITLGLLRVWRSWRHHSWNAPKDRDELISVLTENRCSLTFSELCSTSIYIAENQSTVSISQALVDYQVSRINSYGLPSSNLARLRHPVVFPITDVTFNTNKSSSQSERTQTKKSKVRHEEIFLKLKACLYPKGDSKALTPKILTQNFDSLIASISDDVQLKNLCVLIQWFRYKLNSTCGVNSIKTYHASLSRKWFYLCEQFPLDELNGDELKRAYKDAIDSHTTEKSKKYFGKRIKDLHPFCVENSGFSPIADSYLNTDSTQGHTRAGFVDEALFTALLNTISSVKDLNEADKLCIQSLCIFSYRCGLRPNELRKLRIKDIEHSNIGWVSVRNTHLGRNKTAAGLRKVPLHPMLLEHEKQIINRYTHIKIEQELGQRHPFFSVGSNPKIALDMKDMSVFIGEILKSLSQLDYFVLYHLRHSCLSRLQLILEIREQGKLPTQLSGYNEIQTNKIKYLLFGRSNMNGYDTIAAFAGHESARMTFEHYFHFSDWIVAQKFKNVDFSMPQSKMNHVGLLPKRTVKYQRTIGNALLYLHKKLHVTPLSSNIEQGIVPINLIEKDKEIISIPICYRALSLYELDFDEQDICSKLKITEMTLKKWIDNALNIKALVINSRGHLYSRHFSDSRKNKLLPAPIKMEIEIQTQNQYIKELKKHYVDHRDAINQSISYALNNSNVSRSGIYFRSPDDLSTFLTTMHLFIPKSHWRATTQYLNKSVHKSAWKEALNGIYKSKERSSTGRSKKTQGAVRLELIHPKMRIKKITETKQSSHLLLHLFHMMGIMMMNSNKHD